MREEITKHEFNGKLIIEDFFEEENVRCFYEDDFYSNELMKGQFETGYLTSEFLTKFANREQTKFIFTDINGQKLEGRITGYSIPTKQNDRRDFLNFHTESYHQDLLYSENTPTKIELRYLIPYLSIFSRDIIFFYGLYEDYIFKFNSPKFELNLNIGRININDWVYSKKHIEPDSILTKEMYLELEAPINDYNEKAKIIDYWWDRIEEIMLGISFLINHRASYMGFDAELKDEKNKLTEIITYKSSEKRIGDDFLKEVSSDFKKFFSQNNLTVFLNSLLDKINSVPDIRRILYSYISIFEIPNLQPQFLSTYFLLEAISKMIIVPTKKMKSENLIKEASAKLGIDINSINFVQSNERRKKLNSELEWEISEYRNYLTHFYGRASDIDTVVKELVKMIGLCRKLVFGYINPNFIEWNKP
ncbi:MAG: hypothetical protein WAR79_00320 [Melioribacteraceae bacterium]